MPNIKGIILAGGNGTRLLPLTKHISKQLLPVYDKPMIYYPMSTLMLAGIRDILLITDPSSLDQFKSLLGDGSDLGLNIQYEVQEKANGIAEALLIGESFINGDRFVLALGDNLLYGNGVSEKLAACCAESDKAFVFGYKVTQPEQFGIIETDDDGIVLSIEEKPKHPKSDIAAIGLYVYPSSAIDIARTLQRSPRGELEITDLNSVLLSLGQLCAEILGRGYGWFDMGTQDSLLDAGLFIRTVQATTKSNIGCLEEIAVRNGWTQKSQLLNYENKAGASNYYRTMMLSIDGTD